MIVKAKVIHKSYFFWANIVTKLKNCCSVIESPMKVIILLFKGIEGSKNESKSDIGIMLHDRIFFNLDSEHPATFL